MNVNAMKFVVPIVGILGIALAIIAFASWREYRRFTVTAEAVVSQRTPTYCVVRLDGAIPGGAGHVEISYSRISGTRYAVPPEDGPEFNLGDKVTLIHPPGFPSSARLKEGFASTVPPWLGWLGVVLVVASLGLFLIGRKRPARRRLHFASLDEALADAEYLAAHPTRQLGNWTLGQNLMHLATVYEKSIDGTAYRPGRFASGVAKFVVPIWKWWVLRNGLPSGIRPPAFMFKEVAPPDHVTTEEGLRVFRRAIGRLKEESDRDWEQCFGVFTREEWDQFHVRHAELHLSFIMHVEETEPGPETGRIERPR